MVMVNKMSISAKEEFELDIKMYDYHSRDLFQKIKEVGLSGRRRNRQRTPKTVS